jgi:hypothetical protein
MTALAVGVDKKLREAGNTVIGSDEYFATLDKTMRKRFPEYFGIEETSQRQELKLVQNRVRW